MTVKAQRVTDTVYLNALPPEWNTENATSRQSTPGSNFRRRFIREVSSLEMLRGFEYFRIGDTYRWYESELWRTITDRSYQEEKKNGYLAFGERYRTKSGRTVWRRHRSTDLMKPRLP